MSAGVYEIVFLPSGRKYIGSSMRVKRRLKEHRRDLVRGAHGNRLLQAAWDKHGPDAFEFRIIENISADVDTLLAREQWHLDQPGSKFNICLAAGSTLGIKQPPASDTLRAFRAEMARKRRRSPEERAKISASLTGRKNGPHSPGRIAAMSAGRRGIRPTEETRAKMREKAKGRKLPERTPEIDAKIKASLRAAWVRRKERAALP
jgi:group I intron endonuclease